jgi:hypothetical protein
MQRRLKNYALVLCLFTFLFIVLGAALRLYSGTALVGAVTGTPLLVYPFNRITSVGREGQSALTVDKVGRPKLTAGLGEREQ